MLCGQGQHYRLKTTHRVEQAAEADGCAVLRRQGQRAVRLHGQGSGTAADAHGVGILPRNIFPSGEMMGRINLASASSL